MKPHHDHISEALAEIDAELGRQPLTIEESLEEAVLNGRMTEQESKDCLDAYIRSFDKTHELYD